MLTIGASLGSQELSKVCRLRYSFFVQHLGWSIPTADHESLLEGDAWDAKALHFVVGPLWFPLGALRVLTGGGLEDMMLGNEFQSLLPIDGVVIEPERDLEITRFFTRPGLPRFLRTAVIAVLYALLWRWAAKQRLDRWWFVANKPLVGALRAANYEVVEISRGHMGSDPDVCLVAYVDIGKTRERLGLLDRALYELGR